MHFRIWRRYCLGRPLDSQAGIPHAPAGATVSGDAGRCGCCLRLSQWRYQARSTLDAALGVGMAASAYQRTTAALAAISRDGTEVHLAVAGKEAVMLTAIKQTLKKALKQNGWVVGRYRPHLDKFRLLKRLCDDH